ncbi:hypothetical protein DFA_12251 [Cavenderia fasciculata]|uniref:Uncharacterized protein n=1 Tax=Cavenderia fasciculata TaxID=261658 RepID=F4QCV4_CACFS|nr:uncharacterized protein DFA_12251 [Cavenderia fasciculata]EGG14478.1 hypothetical protein DFA_12251 [Cavenderia fasciculata]|eukprot:XP_004353887.1 hypothetical protein DFA_12251 [Cavenderia fasciculata]
MHVGSSQQIHTCRRSFVSSRNRQQQRGNEFKGSLDIIVQHGNIIIKFESLICKSLVKVLKVHQAKYPSKFTKRLINQPKNSPSPSPSIISSSDNNNNVKYLQRYVKSLESTQGMIRVLDLMNFFPLALPQVWSQHQRSLI